MEVSFLRGDPSTNTAPPPSWHRSENMCSWAVAKWIDPLSTPWGLPKSLPQRDSPNMYCNTVLYIVCIFQITALYIYIFQRRTYIYIYKNVLYWCINSISCLFNSPPCCPMLISFIHHFFPMIPFSLLAAHFLSSPMYFIYFSFSFRTSMAISAVCHGCYRNSGHCGHGRRFEHASKFRRACLSVMAWSLTHEERKSVTWCKLEQLVLYHDYLLTIFSGYNDVDIPFGIYHLYYHSGYTING